VLTAGLAVATSDPALAYSPGTAVAYKPKYNVDHAGWDYHCSFAKWRSGAKVSWHCTLSDIYLDDAGLRDDPLVTHTGNWTPPPSGYSSATWVRELTVCDGELCVTARGLNVDGGVVSLEKWPA
jgi:hypothetical protein